MQPIEDPFYILTASPPPDEKPHVLKHGDTFAVFDRTGDIRDAGLGEEGLYHQGTRYLSRLFLRVEDRRLMSLGSEVSRDNGLLAVDLSNPDILMEDRPRLTRETIHVQRTFFLREGGCYMELTVRNFALERACFRLSLLFAADFSDIFEVRGIRRARRGELLDARVEKDRVTIPYHGLDRVERLTRVSFSPAPDQLEDFRATYDLSVEPRTELRLYMAVTCDRDEGHADEAWRRRRRESGLQTQVLAPEGTRVTSSSAPFTGWVDRSVADLRMMTTGTDEGPYPYAGVPWFSTPFGRDGIITALQTLWIEPSMARGVLRYLARHQARDLEPERDAEPGKILHEVRRGEMAATGEIPFGRYYGAVDSTPLFLMLAGDYYRRTADLALIEELWPHLEAALRWISDHGDSDRDGFVDYARRCEKGLVTQGWKDSSDSVFHADGELAQGPIALGEVQGYVYAAWIAVSELARARGDTELSTVLLRSAESMQSLFEEKFWCEDRRFYAAALDGSKRRCAVRTSNAGHLLYTGMIQVDRAQEVGRQLLSDAFFSGWGVRTVAAGEARYNPMAYHNGSVWPHDNSLIAAGLARYGMKDEAVAIFQSLFDVARETHLMRLPELFCGFTRREDCGPTRYPVACSPQAWASGAVFLLLQACLGLEIDAPGDTLHLDHPVLPPGIDQIAIENLRIGRSSVDLHFERHPADCVIRILRRTGPVKITVTK